MNYMYVEYLL